MCILLFCCAFSMSFAQETVDGIRREIKSVEAETAREKSLHEAEKKRHADFVESSRQKVLSLNDQNRALKAEIDSLHKELGRLADARNNAAAGTRWYEARKLKYRLNLADVIDSLAPFLEADFPYKTDEAVASVHETASQLRKGILAPDDALGRVFEVLGERIRLGYTTEAWDGFLKAPDGRSVSGTFFRYGAVASIFVSNDGEDVFWLSNGKNGYSWNYVKEPLSLRTDIKEAMKVAQGKGAPHLVTIPIAGSSVMIPVKSGPVERHSGSVSVKGNAK